MNGSIVDEVLSIYVICVCVMGTNHVGDIENAPAFVL